MPLTDPLSKSDARDTVVACSHVDRCGGCPILSLSYGEQLLVKRGRVVQSVGRYPALELVYTEPLLPADPITHYRTRAKLIVGPQAAVGLFAKGGGHQVVDIPGCQVLSPALRDATQFLRERIARDERDGGPLAPASETGGALRAIDLRETRGAEDDRPPELLLTLVLSRSRAASVETLEACAREIREGHPAIVGVAVNFHDGESPQVLGNETKLLSGAESRPDRVGRSVHLATYGSFVQSHRGQAARVHGLLVESLGIGTGRAPKVLDLYGGSGSIALALAAAGAEVTLVESFPPAVSQALAAARSQGVILKAECQDVGTSLKQRAAAKERFDAAVVNPSRRGMSPLAREGLAKLDIPVIAYVSCDPDTLARDLDHFVRLGYSTSTLRPLDMIPLTDEVETVTVLRRGPPPPPQVLYEDDDVLVLAKAPHEAVAPRAEGGNGHGISLKDRAARLPGGKSLRAIGRDDTSTSGIVFFAKTDEAYELFTKAFADPSTRRVYVAYVRGVTPQKGTIARDLREDGRTHPSRTRYRRLAIAGGHSVLRVVPELERAHQLRRHLAAIGHPVLGDERYGHAPSNRFFEERNGLDRTFLHGVRVEIDHPRTRAKLLVECPLHGDLRAVLERTSGPGTLRFLEQKHALGSGPQSSFPPPPDSASPIDSALEIDIGTPSVRIELSGDDDDSRGSIF